MVNSGFKKTAFCLTIFSLTDEKPSHNLKDRLMSALEYVIPMLFKNFLDHKNVGLIMILKKIIFNFFSVTSTSG